jgi:hypothetical protein
LILFMSVTEWLPTKGWLSISDLKKKYQKKIN